MIESKIEGQQFDSASVEPSPAQDGRYTLVLSCISLSACEAQVVIWNRSLRLSYLFEAEIKQAKIVEFAEIMAIAKVKN